MCLSSFLVTDFSCKHTSVGTIPLQLCKHLKSEWFLLECIYSVKMQMILCIPFPRTLFAWFPVAESEQRFSCSLTFPLNCHYCGCTELSKSLLSCPVLSRLWLQALL